MKNLKILVVDDDEADRKNFIRMLEQTSLQVNVTEAEDAVSAYEEMKNAKFDCVIMDFWMPGEDGISGVKRISDTYSYIPVIMLTVESGLPTVVKALKSGAVDYISKDQANRGSIQRAIENAVEKSEIRKIADDNRQDLVRFADMMVHDIKAPVNHIRNFVDLLIRGVKRGEFDRIYELTDHIQDSSDKLIDFLDTLTKYTRSNQPVELESVDLKGVLTDVMVVLDEVIREKGAKIEIGDLHQVSGNEAFIHQLLQNLIANALKFVDKAEPMIRIESVLNGDIVTLKVSDNGIGIPEASLEKVFHPFNRLHSKNEYPGTGLGLATCERIVERLGGRIWCESVEGKGSTFFSEFQAAQPAS